MRLFPTQPVLTSRAVQVALAATLVLNPLTMSAQERPASASTPLAATALPEAPLTRVLAIGSLTREWTPAERAAVMPREVRETVALYLAGKISDWYARKDAPGVVFLLNVKSVQEAHDLLEALPLGVAKLMQFQLIPLGPLTPLALLTGAGPGERR